MEARRVYRYTTLMNHTLIHGMITISAGEVPKTLDSCGRNHIVTWMVICDARESLKAPIRIAGITTIYVYHPVVIIFPGRVVVLLEGKVVSVGKRAEIHIHGRITIYVRETTDYIILNSLKILHSY